MSSRPPKVRVDKAVLGHVLQHTETHNRILQQQEMWAAREKELALEAQRHAVAGSRSTERGSAGVVASSAKRARTPSHAPSARASISAMDEFNQLMGVRAASIDWEEERRRSEAQRIASKGRLDDSAPTERWRQDGLHTLQRGTAESSAAPANASASKRTWADLWKDDDAVPTPHAHKDASQTSERKKSSHRDDDSKHKANKSSHKRMKRHKKPKRKSRESSSSSDDDSDSDSSTDSDSDSHSDVSIHSDSSHSARHKSRNSHKRTRSRSSSSYASRSRSRSRSRSHSRRRRHRHAAAKHSKSSRKNT